RRAVPLHQRAGGHRGQGAHPEVDRHRQPQPGGREAELLAHLDRQAADEEHRDDRRDGGGDTTQCDPQTTRTATATAPVVPGLTSRSPRVPVPAPAAAHQPSPPPVRGDVDRSRGIDVEETVHGALRYVMRRFHLFVGFISWKSRGEELPVLEEWLTGPRGRGNAPVPRDIVQSVSRALKLMDIIGSEPGLTVKQMARRLDLNPTTAYHLVRTLVYEGYLIRDDLGNYSMGPA